MSNKIKVLISAVVITGLAGGALAFADSHRGGHGAERFAAIDTNGDGAVSKAEAEAARAAKFAEADANGDGALTLEEITAHRDTERSEKRAKRQQAMFERGDKNGDGVITVDEFAKPGKRFDRADADGDGLITQDEMKAAAEKRRGGKHHGPRGE